MTGLTDQLGIETGATGDSATEYSAVRDGGAGLIDLSNRGRLLISGSEAVMFLNGLITNDMKALAVNTWMPAAFANVQGRLLAVVRVIHRQDGFLIDTEDVTHDTVLKTLERFTLAGDFHVTDLTNETVSLSVQGKSAGSIIKTVFSDHSAVERREVAMAKLANGHQVTIIRATHTAEDGFDLFVDMNDARELRESLMKAGAQDVSSETLETLRIEAGIPRYGIDMDETTVVTEANLDEAVSFSKGCYLGQEIIVRIKHRGHVAKKLTGLILGEVELEPGAKVLSADDKEIGRVTSATFSPQLDRIVALGYLKYDYLAPGTKVEVFAGEAKIAAGVTELPFIRGSWYSS
jgi:folate-binding protein YgfZ